MTKQEIKLISIFWIVWQIGLRFVGYIAGFLLKFQPSYPYSDSLLAPSGLPQWLYSWAGFDGVHYLTIAEKGYIGTGLIQAFFPVFPILIKITTYMFPLVISGFIISTVLSLILFFVWYFFVKHFFSKKIAKLSLLVLITFPTSFFFTAVYTESLFLIFVLLSFYAVDTKKWGLAILFSFLATATRITGVFLIPSLVLAILLKQSTLNVNLTAYSFKSLSISVKNQLKAFWLQMLFLLLGFLGLGLYMWYLRKEFHDPLYFYHVQTEFGGGREERIILWPQVVWRYFKIFMTQTNIGPHTISFFEEAVTGIIGVLVLVASLKWLKPAWVLFALAVVLLPTLTGTFSSMPRYILVAFPLFILCSLFLERISLWRWLYFLVSSILLIVNIMLFIQGYWVA